MHFQRLASANIYSKVGRKRATEMGVLLSDSPRPASLRGATEPGGKDQPQRSPTPGRPRAGYHKEAKQRWLACWGQCVRRDSRELEAELRPVRGLVGPGASETEPRWPPPNG